MKKIIFLLFLVVFNIYSQNKSDCGNVVFETEGNTYILNSSPGEPLQVSIDSTISFKSRLIFNKFESLFVSNTENLNPQQPNSELVFGGDKKGVSLTTSPVDEKGSQVYRNFKSNEIVFRVVKANPVPAYLVKDNWVEINWVKSNEFKNILGFEVQKAAGYFRGKKFIVWFTEKIPYPYGPGKLFGLPGVILQYENPQTGFVMKAIDVCYPCDCLANEIKKPTEATTYSIKEHVFMEDHSMKTALYFFQKILQDRKGMSMTLNTYYSKKEIEERRKFNSEVIYEWEEYPGDTPKPDWFILNEEKFDKDSTELKN